MKRICLLLPLLLAGCSATPSALKGMNSYQLCAALSMQETKRNFEAPNRYRFTDRQIKRELESRDIDPLSIECGRVGAEYQHRKIMRELKQSREAN